MAGTLFDERDMTGLIEQPKVSPETVPSPSMPPSVRTPEAPTGITPMNGESFRTLLPSAPNSSPVAPQTNMTPPSEIKTAPVVSSPVLGSVGEKSTVAGQIRELLSTGNPYVEQARQRAREAMSSRGLLNSTMAAQAGEEAAIAGALPIASQDATTNFNQGLANQNAQNAFGQVQQQGEISSRLQAEQSAQRMAEAALAGDIQSRQILEQAGYNFQLSAQENINRLQQLALQGDINAQAALQQFGIQRSLLAQEGDIRSRQITEQGDQSARLAELDFNYRALLLDKEAGNTLALEDKRFQTQQSLLMAEYAQRIGLTQEESRLQIERMNLGHQQTLAQIAAQAAATRDAEYGPRLQSQYLASVSERMNTASNEIAQIYSTQGLTAAQQQTAVANAYQRVNQDLSALQAYYRQSPLWDPDWGSTVQPAPAPATSPASGPVMTSGFNFNLSNVF